MFVFAVCAVVSEGKQNRTAVVSIFTEEIPINSADIPGNLVMCSHDAIQLAMLLSCLGLY